MGNRRQQTAGIGMNRTFKQLFGCAGFHNVAQMHDPDPVGNIFDHGQVMGDKQIRCTQLFLNVFHQIDDLGLDGYIQCRNRLVSNNQLRIHDQSPGYADTLALTAGELVGIAVGLLSTQADPFQYPGDLVIQIFLVFVHMMDDQAFGNQLLNLLAGIKAGLRILEDHLHIKPQKLLISPAQFLFTDLMAGKFHMAAGWVEQPDNRTSGC